MVIHLFSIVLDIVHNYSSFVLKMGRVSVELKNDSKVQRKKMLMVETRRSE